VIRRTNILICLHLGYTSVQIAQILNVDRKTMTNVGNAYLEGGLESAPFDLAGSGRPDCRDDLLEPAEELLTLDAGLDRRGCAEA
jgi:hypothetical protein